MLQEFKILVPVVEGKESILVDLKSSALERFGGYTVGPPCEGAWKDSEGYYVYDTVVPFYLATKNENDIYTFAREVIVNLKQEAVYISCGGVAHIFSE